MNTTEITFLRACPTMGRRLTEWLRLDSISGDHLIQAFCSSVVRYRGCPGSCPVGFWECTQMVTPQPLGRICSSVQPQLQKTFFLTFNRNFYISVYIHCLLSHHWPPVRRVYIKDENTYVKITLVELHVTTKKKDYHLMLHWNISSETPWSVSWWPLWELSMFL